MTLEVKISLQFPINKDLQLLNIFIYRTFEEIRLPIKVKISRSKVPYNLRENSLF